MVVAQINNCRLEIFAGAMLPIGAVLIITAVRFGIERSLFATTLFIFSLLLHECGHILLAKLFGIKVAAFGLCKWGAYIRRERAHGMAEIFIAAAGPLMNLLLALAMWNVTGVGAWLAQMNLALFAMNIFPLYGSDGQRILANARGLVFSSDLKHAV